MFTFGDTTVEWFLSPHFMGRCILSPGHSLGSIVYVVKRKGEQDLIVTGDVLFSNSIGRTECMLLVGLTGSWTNVAILNGTSSFLTLAQSIKALEVSLSILCYL